MPLWRHTGTMPGPCHGRGYPALSGTSSALVHGVDVLRLETGINQPDATRLYERYGFQRIPPFGDYEGGPLNVFYEKRLP